MSLALNERADINDCTWAGVMSRQLMFRYLVVGSTVNRPKFFWRFSGVVWGRSRYILSLRDGQEETDSKRDRQQERQVMYDCTSYREYNDSINRPLCKDVQRTSSLRPAPDHPGCIESCQETSSYPCSHWPEGLKTERRTDIPSSSSPSPVFQT